MARVKGGLFSLDASGQLAKTLVYSRWKGLKTVRSYVIPANPQSTAQTAQRNLLADGVDFWHETDLTGADKVAWNLYATTQAKPLSGFNAAVKNAIQVQAAEQDLLVLFDGSDESTTEGQIDAVINAPTGLAVSVRWGETPSSLINSHAMTEEGSTGKYEYTIEELEAGKKYYLQFFITTSEKDMNKTGVYEIVAYVAPEE